jgi:hypothetical protein
MLIAAVVGICVLLLLLGFLLPALSNRAKQWTCIAPTPLGAPATVPVFGSLQETLPRGTIHCVGWPVNSAIRSKSAS